PTLVVPAALLLGGGAGALPPAVLEVHACAIALGGESHLDLRRRLPVGCLPAEHHARRRRAGGDGADPVLPPLREALEEPAALPGLEMDLVGALASEREPLLQRPPLPDVLREEPERVLDRPLHVNRLPDRHCRSSCSAKALKAASASSQSWLTRST